MVVALEDHYYCQQQRANARFLLAERQTEAREKCDLLVDERLLRFMRMSLARSSSILFAIAIS